MKAPATRTARSWPHRNGPEDIRARQDALRALPGFEDDGLALEWPLPPEPFTRVQECLTGYVALPVAVVGPVDVDMGRYSFAASGALVETGRCSDRVLVPLAHTEGGLSASVQRGAVATAAAGGVHTHLLADRIARDSCFVFDTAAEALALARWVQGHAADMRRWLADPQNPHRHQDGRHGVSAISDHAVLREVRTFVLGGMCHVLYGFTTGDACGPNMVTRNAYALNRWYIGERFPAETGLRPRRAVLEANMGGDKKPSYEYFHEGHGKTVLADATLSEGVCRRVLRASVEEIVNLQHVGLHGSHASGMQSAAFTPASAIAAIFAATGQDLGMVATSSMAHMVAEAVPSAAGGAALHVAVRLPGLEVGTVGGGTVLPHARTWLRVLGCDGPDRVHRFAQVIAAAVLCLELSAAASMAAADSENFYRAHLERGGLRVAGHSSRTAEQGVAE